MIFIACQLKPITLKKEKFNIKAVLPAIRGERENDMEIKLKGKSRSVVQRELMRSGFTEFFWIEDDLELDGFTNCSGVCIKSCCVKFNSKGRAVSYSEKCW